MNLEAYPGGDLIQEGLRDLALGIPSDAALLVSIGAPRLERLGLSVSAPVASPEHALYQRFAERDGDAAHSRYNAMIRRLVSFERALECER